MFDVLKAEGLRLTVVWLGLILLTLAAIIGSQLHMEHDVLLTVVAVITISKGILIADVFMDLRAAPKVWYGLMVSYIIIVPALIFAIYFSS